MGSGVFKASASPSPSANRASLTATDYDFRGGWRVKKSFGRQRGLWEVTIFLSCRGDMNEWQEGQGEAAHARGGLNGPSARYRQKLSANLALTTCPGVVAVVGIAL